MPGRRNDDTAAELADTIRSGESRKLLEGDIDDVGVIELKGPALERLKTLKFADAANRKHAESVIDAFSEFIDEFEIEHPTKGISPENRVAITNVITKHGDEGLVFANNAYRDQFRYALTLAANLANDSIKGDDEQKLYVISVVESLMKDGDLVPFHKFTESLEDNRLVKACEQKRSRLLGNTRAIIKEHDAEFLKGVPLENKLGEMPVDIPENSFKDWAEKVGPDAHPWDTTAGSQMVEARVLGFEKTHKPTSTQRRETAYLKIKQPNGKEIVAKVNVLALEDSVPVRRAQMRGRQIENMQATLDKSDLEITEFHYRTEILDSPVKLYQELDRLNRQNVIFENGHVKIPVVDRWGNATWEIRSTNSYNERARSVSECLETFYRVYEKNGINREQVNAMIATERIQQHLREAVATPTSWIETQRASISLEESLSNMEASDYPGVTNEAREAITDARLKVVDMCQEQCAVYGKHGVYEEIAKQRLHQRMPGELDFESEEGIKLLQQEILVIASEYTFRDVAIKQKALEIEKQLDVIHHLQKAISLAQNQNKGEVVTILTKQLNEVLNGSEGARGLIGICANVDYEVETYAMIRRLQVSQGMSLQQAEARARKFMAGIERDHKTPDNMGEFYELMGEVDSGIDNLTGAVTALEDAVDSDVKAMGKLLIGDMEPYKKAQDEFAKQTQSLQDAWQQITDTESRKLPTLAEMRNLAISITSQIAIRENWTKDKIQNALNQAILKIEGKVIPEKLINTAVEYINSAVNARERATKYQQGFESRFSELPEYLQKDLAGYRGSVLRSIKDSTLIAANEDELPEAVLPPSTWLSSHNALVARQRQVQRVLTQVTVKIDQAPQRALQETEQEVAELRISGELTAGESNRLQEQARNREAGLQIPVLQNSNEELLDEIAACTPAPLPADVGGIRELVFNARKLYDFAIRGRGIEAVETIA